MKLSFAQERVVFYLQRGATLSNCWESETAPYRPPDGMHTGYLHYRIRPGKTQGIAVLYSTIKALLKANVIREKNRVTTHTRQGDNAWQSDTIYYCLVEKE